MCADVDMSSRMYTFGTDAYNVRDTEMWEFLVFTSQYNTAFNPGGEVMKKTKGMLLRCRQEGMAAILVINSWDLSLWRYFETFPM